MHEKDLINILGVARGEVDAPHHRTLLRRALLQQEQRSALHSFVTLISMNKYYVSLGSVAAVVAIALVVAISPLNPQVVSAQEQVNRAYARAVAISPEMRAQLEGKMKADMMKTLEEAKAAPDLKIMTREEYEKDAQFTIGKGPHLTTGGAIGVDTAHAVSIKKIDGGELPPEGATFTVVNTDEGGEAGFAAAGAQEDVVFTATAAANLEPGVAAGGTFSAGTFMAAGPVQGEILEPVKYLSYTNPEGGKVVLGLDKNDTPVFKMETLNAGDIKQFENGVVGVEGKQIKMIRVEGTKIEE